jgi:hypothetical protein
MVLMEKIPHEIQNLCPIEITAALGVYELETKGRKDVSNRSMPE